MIRLTVLYDFPPHVDEAESLDWRLTDHHEENVSAPGVLRSDFARIDDSHPEMTKPPYRFMTTAD